jgi:hypothetical protein
MNTDRLPDLSRNFPVTIPDLKINRDLDNRVHGPHYDVVIPIPGGVDKLRIDPAGNPIGGETQIGFVNMPW